MMIFYWTKKHNIFIIIQIILQSNTKNNDNNKRHLEHRSQLKHIHTKNQNKKFHEYVSMQNVTLSVKGKVLLSSFV